MSLIKQLIPTGLKFTPVSDINWTRIETLVHGPGADRKNADDENSAVFSCLMAIALSYPEPPLQVVRKAGGKVTALPDSPLQLLLDQPTPNNELSIDEIRFWTAWAKHVDGNAYWLKIRSGNALTGNVIQVWPISPTLIAPVTIKGSGDFISYYRYQKAPNVFELIPVQNIIHFRLGLDDRDMRKGLAPLKALVRQISTDQQADIFVDTLLRNYAVPGLVVIPKSGVSLEETQADMITERLRSKFGSNNRGNIAVMSEETEVKQFGFSPQDMDLSILHRIPEERISAVIGVPAIVAGLGAGLDRSTYANFKEAREMYTESKLVPQWRMDATKITSGLREDFTNDRRVKVTHDLTEVRAFQEDEDAKYKRLSSAVGQNRPFMLRNEARADVGLDPIDGWDEEDKKVSVPQPPPTPTPQDQQPAPPKSGMDADLERWERKYIKALAAGEAGTCTFESDLIPPDVHAAIAAALPSCPDEPSVKELFLRFRNPSEWDYIDRADRLIAQMERLK